MQAFNVLVSLAFFTVPKCYKLIHHKDWQLVFSYMWEQRKNKNFIYCETYERISNIRNTDFYCIIIVIRQYYVWKTYPSSRVWAESFTKNYSLWKALYTTGMCSHRNDKLGKRIRNFKIMFPFSSKQPRKHIIKDISKHSLIKKCLLEMFTLPSK